MKSKVTLFPGEGVEVTRSAGKALTGNDGFDDGHEMIKGAK